MAERGKILKGQALKEFVEKKKIKEKVKVITLVGYMGYPDSNYEQQKQLIIRGRYKLYFQNTALGPLKNLLELYQLETEAGNFYIMAFIDVFDYEVPDMCIWFYKLKKKIEDSNSLSNDYVYFP